MLWFDENLIEEATRIAQKPPEGYLRKIVIQGIAGSGKSEFIDYFLTQLPSSNTIALRENLQIRILTTKDIVSGILQQTQNTLKVKFNDFLEKFSHRVRSYISKKLIEIPLLQENQYDWYEEIFSQFLNFLGKKHDSNFIFENVNQIDRLQLERLENFIDKFDHLRIRTIFSYDPEGPFLHDFSIYQKLLLDKLSIQTVEKRIQEFFDTSPINARLITNHCYLKTGGNALKIRFLMGTIYQSLLKFEEEEFLNIKKLQSIKIKGNWENIFQIVFDHLGKSEREILALTAQLSEGVQKQDLILFLRHYKLSRDLIEAWQHSGFIIERQSRNGMRYYQINFFKWKEWLQKRIPIEELKQILLELITVAKRNKLSGKYQVSQFLYDMDEVPLAIELAKNEAEINIKENQLSAAADRFYFLVRMWDINPNQVKNIEYILLKLSEIYLNLGMFENAFEILKRQREIILQKYKIKSTPEINQEWVNVNLKMAKVLISMDAYLEARYIIRESRIKKYCDLYGKGLCSEFVGDIESNLGHEDYARKNYEDALNLYQKAGKTEDIYNIYKKLKALLQNHPLEFLRLNSQALDIISRLRIKPEYEGILLLDRVKIYLEDKDYLTSFQSCIQLRRNLQKVYEPKIRFQLALYLSEIFSQLGKWQLAISQIETESRSLYVNHRPSLKVHLLIQLGMLLKEQARYGEAKRTLEQGLELCFSYHYSREQYEIKLHLGHIYLLTHGMLRAYDYLMESYNWALDQQNQDISLLANLYLSYYELQNGRFDKARKYLRKGKKLVNLSQNEVDLLNYLFYLGAWLHEMKRYAHLQSVINLIQSKSKKTPRYQAAAYYLLTRMDISRSEYSQAEKDLKLGLRIAQKSGLPQIQYLLYCEMARLYHGQGDKLRFKRKLKLVINYLQNMQEAIEDEILGRQFFEARFHEDIFKWGQECNVFKVKGK